MNVLAAERTTAAGGVWLKLAADAVKPVRVDSAVNAVGTAPECDRLAEDAVKPVSVLAAASVVGVAAVHAILALPAAKAVSVLAAVRAVLPAAMLSSET